MSLLRTSSPHTRYSGHKTDRVMLMVMVAAVPGFITQTVFFGWGNMIHIMLAVVAALISEACMLHLRCRPVKFFLQDYSAVLTAILIGLSMPPIAPWWITVIAVSFAIVVVKQLYGGLGHNPFNPAMAGYALVLISFPLPMSQWLGTLSGAESTSAFGFSQALQAIFNDLPTIDSYTMATPLDTFKHKAGLMSREAFNTLPGLQALYLDSWLGVNLAYLAGGLLLLYLRIITWHTPVALLLSSSGMAALFYLLDPGNNATPYFHLTTGATMFAAFFIATDPVSSCSSNKGKLLYGTGIGILIYVIRTWGGYPDGVAFAVLLMNFAAPFLDYYSQPRTYGHKHANKGLQIKGSKHD